MDRRTKILAGVLGAAVLYGIVSSVVYPRMIRPWLTLDEEIAKRGETLATLQALEERVQAAKYEYREYMVRAGTQNINHALTDVRDRINKLIEEHVLIEAKVTPSRPAKDRKTNLESAVVTISASGSLQSAVQFLRELAELPHLVRLGAVALTPAASSSRRGMAQDMLNVRVPVEVWTLPDQRIIGRIPPEELKRTEELFVRHLGRDYAKIWSGQPFTDYVPLTASTVPTISVQKGQNRVLEVNATGGRGDYTYQWSPAEGLSTPTSPSTKVDTSEAGTKRYDVTVTDASGKKATANVILTINDPPEPPNPEPTVARSEPKKIDTGPKPWADGQYKELRMALLRTQGSERIDEFMVYDTRNKSNAYYKVGDEFDGGQLVYVHQTGGVARRKDEYYVYPLGLTVQQAIQADAAQDYPELQKAAEFHRNAMAEATRASVMKSPDGAEPDAIKRTGDRRGGVKPGATDVSVPAVLEIDGPGADNGPPAPGDDGAASPAGTKTDAAHPTGPDSNQVPGADVPEEGAKPTGQAKPSRPRPSRKQTPK